MSKRIGYTGFVADPCSAFDKPELPCEAMTGTFVRTGAMTTP